MYRKFSRIPFTVVVMLTVSNPFTIQYVSLKKNYFDIFTARVRRTKEGNVLTHVCLSTLGWGGGTPSYPDRGLPHPVPIVGVAPSSPNWGGWGVPSQI